MRALISMIGVWVLCFTSVAMAQPVTPAGEMAERLLSDRGNLAIFKLKYITTQEWKAGEKTIDLEERMYEVAGVNESSPVHPRVVGAFSLRGGYAVLDPLIAAINQRKESGKHVAWWRKQMRSALPKKDWSGRVLAIVWWDDVAKANSADAAVYGPFPYDEYAELKKASTVLLDPELDRKQLNDLLGSPAVSVRYLALRVGAQKQMIGDVELLERILKMPQDWRASAFEAYRSRAMTVSGGAPKDRGAKGSVWREFFTWADMDQLRFAYGVLCSGGPYGRVAMFGQPDTLIPILKKKLEKTEELENVEDREWAAIAIPKLIEQISGKCEDGLIEAIKKREAANQKAAAE